MYQAIKPRITKHVDFFFFNKLQYFFQTRTGQPASIFILLNDARFSSLSNPTHRAGQPGERCNQAPRERHKTNLLWLMERGREGNSSTPKVRSLHVHTGTHCWLFWMSDWYFLELLFLTAANTLWQDAQFETVIKLTALFSTGHWPQPKFPMFYAFLIIRSCKICMERGGLHVKTEGLCITKRGFQKHLWEVEKKKIQQQWKKHQPLLEETAHTEMMRLRWQFSFHTIAKMLQHCISSIVTERPEFG